MYEANMGETSSAQDIDARATEFGNTLIRCGVGPFFGTPCGVLAPLYKMLSGHGLRTLSREDTALAVATGTALAGAQPAVLMQNSGFGQCVNALASLIAPYRAPILLVISLRGTGYDTTIENAGMGAITVAILDGLNIPYITYDSNVNSKLYDVIHDWTAGPDAGPLAILVSVDAFGWAA